MMKFVSGWMLPGLVVFALTAAAVRADVRRVQSFDFGWRFHKGEAAGAEKPGWNDDKWETVDLPHDWSIEGPYDEKHPGGASFAYLPGGVGWYRKQFDMPEVDRGKRVHIRFDGIYENSSVWLNGQLLGKRGYGFISFQYDLTNHIKFGGNNIIAVRAENLNQPNCRWYSGSGIHGRVWLEVAVPLRVASWGTYVTTPRVGDQEALVRIRTTVRNDDVVPHEFTLEASIAGAATKCSDSAEAPLRLEAGAAMEITREIVIDGPRLWSPENPNLYTSMIRLRSNGRWIDDQATTFGIRTIAYDKDRGFVLNGKSLKMKGVCIHSDGGAVGAAVPDDVWQRRLMTLKEIGCNAIRCSHNPPSPGFLDLCDRLGFLVINEAFDKWNRHFTRDWEQDLRAMLARDRNHPSIVLWSVGNENGMVWSDEQLEIYRRLARVVREEDSTRPVSAALRPAYPPKEDPTPRGLVAQMLPMVDALDVTCLNYQEHLYRELRQVRPEIVIIGSECHLHFRGEGVRYKSDNDSNPWFDVAENDYVAGQFLWTGIDYLGESEGWPAKGKANSLMETTGFRKDCSYWHQSVWSDKPMVHIAVFDESTEDYPQKKFWHWPRIRSHWNFPEKQGEMLRIATYSNCDSVELLLNGRSLGVRKPADFKNRAVVWDVPFQPGELRAVGLDSDKPVAEWTLRTAGPPARVTLLPDRRNIRANGRDVVHVEIRIEDAKGVLVPDAALPVGFAIEGAGRLIGLDNGDLRSGESYKGAARTTWRGRCLAIVQAAANSGVATLRVTTPGLPETSVTWHVTEDAGLSPSPS